MLHVTLCDLNGTTPRVSESNSGRTPKVQISGRRKLGACSQIYSALRFVVQSTEPDIAERERWKVTEGELTGVLVCQFVKMSICQRACTSLTLTIDNSVSRIEQLLTQIEQLKLQTFLVIYKLCYYQQNQQNTSIRLKANSQQPIAKRKTLFFRKSFVSLYDYKPNDKQR